MRPHFAFVLSTALITWCSHRTAVAQTAPPDLQFHHVNVGSGSVHNDSSATELLFSHIVRIPAGSIQIYFGRTTIPDGVVLRLTSLLDGAQQHHRGTTLQQWHNASAWFNGGDVLVELIAPPNSGSMHVTIDRVLAMGDAATERSICLGTDDRVLSFDARSGRIAPIGCTGWLIDDPARQFLTAGHCMDNLSVVDTMEFNVPLSNSDGSWNHPGPEDQYPIDPVSVQFTDDGIGNDWSYYGCFPNTETGLTAYQAQGESHILASAPPAVDGRDITIVGYGTTSSPVDPSWNSVQKTHTGPYQHFSGNNIGYQTDTTGGNSGSPVLDEVTGKSIGIHTHAGCGDSGGWNNGTAIDHPDLQYALAHPLGVCIPSTLVLGFPDGRPMSVLPGTPTAVRFSVEPGDDTPIIDSIRFVMTVDGVEGDLPVTPVGSDIYKVWIPGLACGQIVSYYISATSESGWVATLPIDAPDTQYELPIGELVETVLLETNFDAGLPPTWSAGGLWHSATTACADTGGCGDGTVMYFGVDSSCTFDTGDTVAGTISSEAISLSGVAGPFTLTYCTALETENDTGWDTARVLVNGVLVEQPPEGDWQTRTIELPAISGDTVMIAFDFDSVDDILNAYRGWHIDHVQLVARSIDCTDPDPCPADIDGNGDVGTDDLLAVIAAWGLPGGDADIDGDGTVGTDDLLALIASWGPC